jgi:hypothetical protein
MIGHWLLLCHPSQQIVQRVGLSAPQRLTAAQCVGHQFPGLLRHNCAGTNSGSARRFDDRWRARRGPSPPWCRAWHRCGSQHTRISQIAWADRRSISCGVRTSRASSNQVAQIRLDCFVAMLLAMTNIVTASPRVRAPRGPRTGSVKQSRRRMFQLDRNLLSGSIGIQFPTPSSRTGRRVDMLAVLCRAGKDWKSERVALGNRQTARQGRAGDWN